MLEYRLLLSAQATHYSLPHIPPFSPTLRSLGMRDSPTVEFPDLLHAPFIRWMAKTRTQQKANKIQPPGFILRPLRPSFLNVPQDIPQGANSTQRPTVSRCSKNFFKLPGKGLGATVLSPCFSCHKHTPQKSRCIRQTSFIKDLFFTDYRLGRRRYTLPFSAQLKLQAPTVASLTRFAPQFERPDFSKTSGDLDWNFGDPGFFAKSQDCFDWR